MSKNGVLKALATLNAAYQRELNDPTISLYVSALSDLDDEALMGAILDIIVTSRFFPTVAEVRERAFFRTHPQGIPPAPDLAWNEVMTQVRSVGRRERPVFTHDLIKATLDLTGGYVRLCDALETSEGANRAQFISTYQRLIQSEMLDGFKAALGSGQHKELEA